MIIRRNFRYRHPIPEELLNDYFTDIYEELVYLLGINNSKADFSGIIVNRMNELDSISDLELDDDDFATSIYYTRRFN